MRLIFLRLITMLFRYLNSLLINASPDYIAFEEFVGILTNFSNLALCDL